MGGNCHRHLGPDMILLQFFTFYDINIAIKFCDLFLPYIMFLILGVSAAILVRYICSDFLSNFCCDAREERGVAPYCGLQKQCYQSRYMYQNKIEIVILNKYLKYLALLY